MEVVWEIASHLPSSWREASSSALRRTGRTETQPHSLARGGAEGNGAGMGIAGWLEQFGPEQGTAGLAGA
jgi:hypothetical protein